MDLPRGDTIHGFKLYSRAFINRFMFRKSALKRQGSSRARPHLSLLEDAWIDDADNDQTGDDQSESDECYEEDTTSAGGKFAAYDPILD